MSVWLVIYSMEKSIERDKELTPEEIRLAQIAEATKRAAQIREQGIKNAPADKTQSTLTTPIEQLDSSENEEVKNAEVRPEEPGILESSSAESKGTEYNSENAENEGEGEGGNMSLIRHLEELRLRIIRSLIAFAIGTSIAYFFNAEILSFLTAPAGKLYYMQPAEAFFTSIKVSCFAGFLLALPVIFYQAWSFLLPALTVKERTVIGLLVPSSVFLFISGLLFSFYFVLPIAMEFFIGFGTDYLQPMFSLQQYFGFVFTFIMPFGVIFELPLVILVLAKLGFITSEMLRTKQSMVIFFSFIIGALLSPPDVISQILLAMPMILLYEISYVIVRFVLRK